MNETARNCLACDKSLKGRQDKKFCDDYCRNNYNNRLNSDTTPLVRNINNALRRNRRILEEFLNGSEKPVTISRKRLLEKGFRFQFYTHNYISGKGMYHFCYDHGYLLINNKQDLYMIVKGRKELAV